MIARRGSIGLGRNIVSGAAALACGLSLVAGARAQDTSSQTSPRQLQALAAEEDWGFLADPAQRTDAFDALKYIPIGTGGAYASLGGEERAFYEGFRNEGYGAVPGVSSYGENRLLVHGEIQADHNWRVFAELQVSDQGGRPGGPRPTIDKDALDLVESFVEWRSTARDDTVGAPDLTVRIGRQELDFGAGRVFSSRAGPFGEGPNVLQGMDVARLIWRSGPWRLDLFGGRPVQEKTGVFDDGPAPREGAWGAYLTHGGPDGASTPGFDLYYFGTERPDAVFYPGLGYEHRNTVGARAFKIGAPYDYDVEAFYQFGEVGARAIEAGGVAAQAGWTFQGLTWAPRLGALVGANTGGGGADAVRTFFPPFPRGGYFGNLRAIGPENTAATELFVDLHPTKAVTFSVGSYAFWRTSLKDGVYALSGQEVAGPTAPGRFIGWQPVSSVQWRINPHLTLNAAYETFRLGEFLERSPGLKPIDYTAAWALFRF